MDVPSFANDSASPASSPAALASCSASQLSTRLMVLSETMKFFTTHPFQAQVARVHRFLFFICSRHVSGQLLCRLPINFELRLHPRLCDSGQTLSERLSLFGLYESGDT